MTADARRAGTPSDRFAAAVGSPWFWICFVLLLFGTPFARGLLGRAPPAPPVLGSFPGIPGASGQAVLVDVICFDCGSDGALAAEAMRILQHRSRNLGDALRLVSFTRGSDPARLAELRRKAGPRWTVLDGTPAEVLRQFPGGRGLLLVDERARVRGRYAGWGGPALDDALSDASVLLNLRR